VKAMEQVRDYELKAFFTYMIAVLERLDIAYMVVGGFAATFSGQPRLTIDVDIVVDMKLRHMKPFVAAFPIPDYYVSERGRAEDGIGDSLQRRYPFNVIQPKTGAKVDLVPLPRDPFTRAAFGRRQRLAYDNIFEDRLAETSATASDRVETAPGFLVAGLGLRGLVRRG